MGNRIHVFGLDHHVTSSDLEMSFLQYGEVREVHVIEDRETGASRGYAFVQMGSEREALDAVSGLNGTVFKGKKIGVELVKAVSRSDKHK